MLQPPPPILDSLSKVEGLIFLNSPSRLSTCFLFLPVVFLSFDDGVPLKGLSPFSSSRPKFLEDILLTSSSWLLYFGILFFTMLRSSTSFIYFYCCCSFFSISLSALKTCSSIVRFLMASRTWVAKLPSLFCPGSLVGPCSGLSSSLTSSSFYVSIITIEIKFFCL
jgi:hypothetical protein